MEKVELANFRTKKQQKLAIYTIKNLKLAHFGVKSVQIGMFQRKNRVKQGVFYRKFQPKNFGVLGVGNEHRCVSRITPDLQSNDNEAKYGLSIFSTLFFGKPCKAIKLFDAFFIPSLSEHFSLSWNSNFRECFRGNAISFPRK